MEAVGSATETRDQFLQLLVTQLRNQDPLEPTKQEDFLAQLAQFSTLEGIEKLNENVEGFLSAQVESQETQNSALVELQQFQNMTSAATLVGKDVEYSNDTGVTSTGRVDAVVIQQDAISLRIGAELIPVEQVQEIRQAATAQADEPLAVPAQREDRLT